jgi:hypothetical protein
LRLEAAQKRRRSDPASRLFEGPEIRTEVIDVNKSYNQSTAPRIEEPNTDSAVSVVDEEADEAFLGMPDEESDGHRSLLRDHPETRLALAVLGEGIETYLNHIARPSRNTLRAYEAARRWIQSRSIEWPFSFENLCSILDLDAEVLRRRLEAIRLSGKRQVPRQYIRHSTPRRLTVRLARSWAQPTG